MGTNWQAINSGLTPFGFVLALALDPSNPSTLYAGADGGGVFKSTDMGANWTAINNGLTNIDVRALTLGHCHVNRVGPQRPAWIPFQAAAVALSHTLNASFSKSFERESVA